MWNEEQNKNYTKEKNNNTIKVANTIAWLHAGKKTFILHTVPIFWYEYTQGSWYSFFEYASVEKTKDIIQKFYRSRKNGNNQENVRRKLRTEHHTVWLPSNMRECHEKKY